MTESPGPFVPISYCPSYTTLAIPCIKVAVLTTGESITSRLMLNKRCLDLFLCVIGATCLLSTQPVLDVTSFNRKETGCFPDKRVMQVLLVSQGITLLIEATTRCVYAFSIEEKPSGKDRKQWNWQKEIEKAEGYGLRAMAMIALAVTVKLIEEWSYRQIFTKGI